jgi:hypothetical protein
MTAEFLLRGKPTAPVPGEKPKKLTDEELDTGSHGPKTAIPPKIDSCIHNMIERCTRPAAEGLPSELEADQPQIQEQNQ